MKLARWADLCPKGSGKTSSVPQLGSLDGMGKSGRWKLTSSLGVFWKVDLPSSGVFMEGEPRGFLMGFLDNVYQMRSARTENLVGGSS